MFWALSFFSGTKGQGADEVWQELEKGLYLATSEKLLSSEQDKGQLLKILRVDPDHFRLKLLSASESDKTRKTIKDWGHEYDLQAVINAGMFWEDLQTSAGYMKNFEHKNSKQIHPEFNAFLVFNPQCKDLPAVQLLDRQNQDDWRHLLDNYQTAVQSYRMISSKRKNTWEESNKSYSVASVALDQQGRILFIFCQQPSSIPELNNLLLQLPLDIQSSMFMEGGPTAGLYINANNLQGSWQGASKSTLWSARPGSFVQVPNVLGILRKK